MQDEFANFTDNIVTKASKRRTSWKQLSDGTWGGVIEHSYQEDFSAVYAENARFLGLTDIPEFSDPYPRSLFFEKSLQTDWKKKNEIHETRWAELRLREIEQKLELAISKHPGYSAFLSIMSALQWKFRIIAFRTFSDTTRGGCYSVQVRLRIDLE